MKAINSRLGLCTIAPTAPSIPHHYRTGQFYLRPSDPVWVYMGPRRVDDRLVFTFWNTRIRKFVNRYEDQGWTLAAAISFGDYLVHA